MANHGVYVTQNETSLSTPNEAQSGIPFVVGIAPLGSDATATAGTPVLCSSFNEFKAACGYNDTWSTYTLCEFAYAYFTLGGMQPAIFLPLKSGATAADVATAFESVELCLTMFGIVPDLLVAPGWSNTASVAAAMTAKAASINGMFKAVAVVDIAAADYSAAITAKTSGSFDDNEIVCWPKATLSNKNGDNVFWLSSLVATRLAQTDYDNGGVPYESPSNKSITCDGLCDANGKEILLSKAEADLVNAQGIVTALNFMGSFVVWGNYTGGYPDSTDVKDYFIPIKRMFSWVNNTLINTFWSNLDAPMTTRLIESITDSCNIWINGLVGSGYVLGGRVEVIEDENPATNLMAGIVKLHVYMTPPSPAQEIDFVLEYDADYVTSVFSAS